MPLLGVNSESLTEGYYYQPWSVIEVGPEITEVVEALGTQVLRALKSFEPAYLALSHAAIGLTSNFAEVNEWTAYT